jgi:hypothetical protein
MEDLQIIDFTIDSEEVLDFFIADIRFDVIYEDLGTCDMVSNGTTLMRASDHLSDLLW